MATLLVPGALRTETDGAARLELAATGTLGEVLDEVTARWPRLARRIRDEHGELRRYINVYVDGEDCRALAGLQTPVSTGSEVQVLPSVAGGSISERRSPSAVSIGTVPMIAMLPARPARWRPWTGMRSWRPASRRGCWSWA